MHMHQKSIRSIHRSLGQTFGASVFPTKNIPAYTPSNGTNIMIIRFISTTTTNLLLLLTFQSSTTSLDFEKLKTKTKKQYTDGSYTLTHEIYTKTKLNNLPPV